MKHSKAIWIIAAVLVAAIAAGLLWLPRGFHNTIVDVRSQKYSHAMMMDELATLTRLYPEALSMQIADTTLEGRALPLVTFGNPATQHHVMIQSTMHAREYMASQMTMALLEQYAWAYANDREIDGHNIRELFNDVCFTILPMVNPDGASISQMGIDGVNTPEGRRWLAEMIDSGYNPEQIKSNARGVDINRNFSNGFGYDPDGRAARNFDFYPGESPLSEVESQLMMRVARMHDYDCFLNYHTSGNLIYYGCGNAADSVNAAARAMSELISRHTGYEGFGPESAPPNGSWADEVEVLFLRPSATIELGTRNPVPISESAPLYKRHTPVWADLAHTIATSSLFGQ